MFNKKLIIVVFMVMALLAVSAIMVSAQQGSGACPYDGECSCYGYGQGAEAVEVPCRQQMRYGMQAGQGQGMIGQQRQGAHHMGNCPLLETSGS